MANLPLSDLFGAPDERLETAVVLKQLKITRNGLANLCHVHRATAGRWRKWIPKKYHPKIKAALIQ
jgi:hypothetical protein